MQISASVAVVLFLSFGCTYGQNEDLLGLPVEYDIFGLDFRDDLFKDRDIFKEAPDTPDSVPDETIRKLCEQFDLVLQDQKINCDDLKLVQKGLEVTQHDVRKRDVDELEGSGAGEEPTPEPIQAATTENEAPAVVEEKTEAPPEAVAVAAEETKIEPVVVAANEAAPALPAEVEATTDGAAEGTTMGIVPAVTEGVVVKEQAVTDLPVVKKGRKLQAGAAAAETPAPAPKEAENGNVDTDKTDVEKMNEHQSGNALVDSPNSGTLEGSDKVVKEMATNAKIKGSTPEAEEPKSGESAKETQQGRKDTKVLIILVVAVVVAGVAAFAYNFIKKRKQKGGESRPENGGERLQDLPSSTKTDAEFGTELKPLMKTAEPKPIVEYTDEKENGKVEVN